MSDACLSKWVALSNKHVQHLMHMKYNLLFFHQLSAHSVVMDLCSFCSFPLNKALQSWFTPTSTLSFQDRPSQIPVCSPIKMVLSSHYPGRSHRCLLLQVRETTFRRMLFFLINVFRSEPNEPNFPVLSLYVSAKAWDANTPLKTETQHRRYGCKHTREMNGQFGRALWCFQNTHLSWMTP